MVTKEAIRIFDEDERILMKGEDFIYLLPHPELRDWISNYTITFPYVGMMTDDYTVIPHGSATLVYAYSGGSLRSELFGPITKPTVVGRKANQSELIFIIEFQPAGLSVLTGIKQKELIDKIVPFNSINPVLDQAVVDIFMNADNIYELLHVIEHLFLVNQDSAGPVELRLSVQKIIEHKGNISIKDLSAAVFYSERHLNSIFDQYLGMSIKSFSRLVRVNKAIRLLQNPQHTMTDVCIASGFYDLPHFIHDFRSVCGLTPNEYRNNMSDFYNEIAKF